MSLRDKYVQSLRSLSEQQQTSVTIRWRSPSNIALVKYWGKHGNQLPINPSISFTLSECATDTSIDFSKKQGPSSRIDLQFYFNGEENVAFATRIKNYLSSILDICPYLVKYDIRIESGNSFPHSAGIASSASAFSALALCITSLEDIVFQNLSADEEFRKKASFLARLGSGSASRSIFAKAGWWGQSPYLEGSSDEFAVDGSGLLHPVFENFQDSILIVSADAKSVSSTAGHQLMAYHPYREGRLTQVHRHLGEIKSALQTGDLEKFGTIVENEALSLHALMLSSSPGYFLVTGKTMNVIEKIRFFRKNSSIPCYFTLDAGPNVHLLYPKEHASAIQEFIEHELTSDIKNVLFDELGNGPQQLV